MVHDYLESDMWFHDTMVDLSIGSNFHTLWKKIYDRGKMDAIEHAFYTLNNVPTDRNPRGLTEVELHLTRIIPHIERIKDHLKERLVSDGYRLGIGLVTHEELASTEQWFSDASSDVDLAVRHLRSIRGWNHVSREEFYILIDEIQIDYQNIREKIRDRYMFDREIDRRISSLK
jgi:hypothetical protein